MSREQIIADILSEADREVESIRARSEKSLEQRVRATEVQLGQIESGAEERIATQRKAITERWERSALQKERRVALELQDSVVSRVTERARTLITEHAAADFRETLREWGVEAIVGLGLGAEDGTIRLRVRGDHRRIVETLFPEIAEGAERFIGFAPALSLDESSPSEGDVGVVALDETGRRAFSNTLSDRLHRSARDIHREVVTTVFSENKSENTHE